ncbi:MAG: S8 family serine peptidase [Bacillota bacterium]
MLAFLLLLGLVVGLSLPVSGNSASLPAEETTRVFIQLTSAPLAEAKPQNQAQYLRSLDKEKGEFRAAASKAKISFKERYTFSHLFNGLSAEVRVADLPKLSRLSGVAQIFPVVEVEKPATEDGGSIEPDMATAVELTGAAQANDLGYTGAGITVGIIDTGIDYTHPDLGGCTEIGAGCRVVGGYDFVGDDGYGDTHWTPNPDPDPMDYQSHGTHVAGIVGANGAVRGVAPEVTFRAYKVFDQGSSSADVIVAAMEMALADGVDVVNMSLGAAFQWGQYPTAVAANHLVNQGVVVVASAGNSGREGLFSGGAPALGEKVIAVASVDNTHSPASKALLGDGAAVAYSLMTYSPPADTLPPTAIAALPTTKLGCTAADYYDGDGNSLVAGKVALVSRGACTFAAKSGNAKSAGAVALMVHNNSSGLFGGTLGAAGDHIPTVAISLEDGNLIRSKLPTTIQFTAETFFAPNPVQGGLISDFSSWGLSPDLTLKPDVAAPGGNIYSTVPVAMGSYGVKGGTSMSAPHVAGATALLLQANPRINSQAMRTILQNTARPVLFSKSLPYLLPVHRQGAGLIDILAALDYGTKVEPAKLSLGELADGETVTRSLTVENRTDAPVTYNVTHTPGLVTGPMKNLTNNNFSLYLGPAAVSGDSLTVPAGATATLTVTITAPSGLPARSIFGGWINLVPEGSTGPAARVPYAGMVGDYQGLTILNRNGYAFPWLATLSGGTYYKVDAMSIDISNGEAAYLLVNFAHQARKVRIDVVAANGRTYPAVFTQEYRGRHATPVYTAPNLSFYSAFAWDGADKAGRPVPNGDYSLVLSVLKPLGDENNPAHWESWTSGTVTVTGSHD